MKAYLEQSGILPDHEVAALSKIATVKKLERQEYFIQSGWVCKEVAFITSGILRSFYVSDAGEEITYCISFPGHFMTAYSSFISGQKSIENIQALAPAELLILPKQAIESMAAESLSMTRFLRSMAEQEYMTLEKRMFSMQKEKARERYLNLTKDHPDYVKHIPVQHLASYLGITQRHLSRIRKEIVI